MLQPLVQKKVFLIIMIFSFLFITWLIFNTSQGTMEETWPESVVKLLLYPFQKTVYFISNFFSDTWQTITGLATLTRENYELHKELSKLETELSQLRQLEAENDRLRKALDFAKSVPLDLVPVEIVARNPSHWMNTVVIDKGRNHGLTKNMPVIAKEGVIGRILNVRPNSSEVILLTDPREGNSMSGVIERSRELVYIYGGGPKSYCVVRPSDLDVKFEVGDRILTSESNLYFPKDLTVGTIQKIIDHGDGFEQEALMKPAVSLSRTEYVYVVKKMKNQPEEGR